MMKNKYTYKDGTAYEKIYADKGGTKGTCQMAGPGGSYNFGMHCGIPSRDLTSRSCREESGISGKNTGRPVLKDSKRRDLKNGTDLQGIYFK